MENRKCFVFSSRGLSCYVGAAPLAERQQYSMLTCLTLRLASLKFFKMAGWWSDKLQFVAGSANGPTQNRDKLKFVGQAS